MGHGQPNTRSAVFFVVVAIAAAMLWFQCHPWRVSGGVVGPRHSAVRHDMVLLHDENNNNNNQNQGNAMQIGRGDVAIPHHNQWNEMLALQAWKASITSDPNRIMDTWVGPDVCQYGGVFCAPPPDGSCPSVVAGIDLNHMGIGGTLPEEIGLHLRYLALLHLNSNRFRGRIPLSISYTTLPFLYELDLSNNLFTGPFPSVLLTLPSLAYLDIRFNGFSGTLPAALFTKEKLDAIFVNDNLFSGPLPPVLASCAASVIVLANNRFVGSIPSGFAPGIALSLNELLFHGNFLDGCIPDEFARLTTLTVLDLSDNKLTGPLPPSFSALRNLQQLNVARNSLCGTIPDAVCRLPGLRNFTASGNFFTAEDPACVGSGIIVDPFRRFSFDDTRNCIPSRAFQRPPIDCNAYYNTYNKFSPTKCPAKVVNPQLPDLSRTLSNPFPLISSPPPHVHP